MEKLVPYEVLDARFAGLVNSSALVHQLHTGSQWAEGPAYFAGGRYLVWSDIPGNRILRYDEADGNVSAFRQPSENSNGNTVDRQGRLITCEHSGRRVSRTEHDGSISVIADRFDGKRLNSPNDVVVKSDGSVWFTDPSYGIDTDYEGDKAASEIGACNVYRADPVTGTVEAVIRTMVRPNGLAFSPDESLLYVADTSGPHQGQKLADLLVFTIDETGRPINGRRFADKSAGGFDGFRVDSEGRLWTSAGPSVECYLPDGTLIGRIKIPETVSNCCFGGPKRNVLYMTATTSLYCIRLMVNGAKTY